MDTKALRQKVLDLAIRGKLVPQNPNDEPASVLLERIRQQKQQMVKEGKLKAKDIKNDTIIFVGEDNLHYEKFADGSVKCIEDEIPFELPEGWAWTRLGNLCAAIQYGLSNSAESMGSHKFLRITDIQNGIVNWDTVPFARPSDPDTYLLKSGDIVFARTGATVGKSFLITETPYPSVYASYLIRIRLLGNLPSEYIYQFFDSACYWSQITDKSVGVGQPNCNGTSLKELLIPLPPINEQLRIIPTVQNLLKYVTIIDTEEKALTSIATAAKAKILDLAIRGKLVPQNQNDEPASVLLERIRAEKKELIKAGKIKRDKRESVIFRGEDNSYYIRQDTHTESIDEQFVFELPDNWEWCSLRNIAKIELGKTLDRAKNTGTNYPYLRSINVRWNEVDLSDLKEMQFEPEELDRYTVRQNDLLICEGGDVGRSCVWTDDKEILYQNALHRVRFYGECNPFYFMYHMMYYESRGIIKSLCKGVTIKHLTGNVLSLIPFALPPLEEQSRIVEKLDQIFALIEGIISD
jgi:type I restriction enzyme S subunit